MAVDEVTGLEIEGVDSLGREWVRYEGKRKLLTEVKRYMGVREDSDGNEYIPKKDGSRPEEPPKYKPSFDLSKPEYAPEEVVTLPTEEPNKNSQLYNRYMETHVYSSFVDKLVEAEEIKEYLAEGGDPTKVKQMLRGREQRSMKQQIEMMVRKPLEVKKAEIQEARQARPFGGSTEPTKADQDKMRDLQRILQLTLENPAFADFMRKKLLESGGGVQ